MGSVSSKTIACLIGVLLFAVVVRVYLPATDCRWVFDDYGYLVENPRVHFGLTVPAAGWAFTSTGASNWHPLTWLSHMLDVTVFGPKPMGHRMTSALLHALATLLLFAALSRMTGSVYKSAFVAAMFALHPLHVESVAWVAERKDVLSGLFWMLALLAYAGYARKPGGLRYAGVLLVFALGLMSKPMVITLPIVLLLLDYWPLDRLRSGRSRYWPLLVEKLPLFAMSAASAVITVIAQHSGGAVASAASLPFGMRAANAVVAYVVYVRKMFWPSDLAVYYPHPLGSLPIWQTVGSAALLIAVTYLALRCARKAPYVAVGWLWYFVTLIPVIGLVQVGKQAMADRYTYIPLTGLFIIVAWGVPALAAAVIPAERVRQIALALLAAVAIAGATTVTYVQLSYWRNEVTLFSHALDVTESNWMAHHGLAHALFVRGKTEQAIEHYTRSIAIDPTNADVHNGLATALFKMGRVKQALSEFRKTVRLDPDNAGAHLNFGAALEQQHKLPEAAKELKRAAELAPDNPLAHANLAAVLAQMGSYAAAVEHYTTACRLTNYTDLSALTNLAEAYFQAGRREEAVRAARQALALAQSTGKPAVADYIRGRLRAYEKR